MAITNFIPQIWSAALLEAFKASQVVIPTLNRQYEGDARSGNKVNITAITTPTVQNYGASRSLTINALSDSTVPLLINQEKAIGFKVNDVDRVQAAGTFDAVISDSAKALIEDAETYVITQMSANGTSAGVGALTTSAAAYSAVLGMRTKLANANAPSTDRYLLVNPEFAALLLGSDSKIVSVDAGPDNEVRNGVVGRLLGFLVLESPLLANDGKPAGIAYHGLSVAYANQIEKVETDRMEAGFDDIVKMLHVYGAKVLRSASVQTWIAAT